MRPPEGSKTRQGPCPSQAAASRFKGTFLLKTLVTGGITKMSERAPRGRSLRGRRGPSRASSSAPQKRYPGGACPDVL